MTYQLKSDPEIEHMKVAASQQVVFIAAAIRGLGEVLEPCTRIEEAETMKRCFADLKRIVLGVFLVGALAMAAEVDAQLTSVGNQLWNQNNLLIEGQIDELNAFGSAVTAGDFDGDGFDDLAIGIHNQSTEGITWSGAVVVIFGEAPSLSPCCTRVLNLNQNSPGSVDEAEVGDRFGWTLATGDFNDDGYDDLAVGVTEEDVYGVRSAGAVQVFYGPELLLDNELWSLATLGQTMNEDDWFGRRLETGDFNGDGYGDLAVGAWTKDIGVLENPGAVAAIYGSVAGLRPQGAQFWTIDDVGSEGLVAYAKLGLSLAAGDFDGDGFDDLAMSAYEDADYLSGDGHVYVLYGLAIGLAPSGKQAWNVDNVGVQLSQAPSNSQFGASVAAGDFDGDGFDDLGIGCPCRFYTDSGIRSGSAFVLYGQEDGLTSMRTQDWHRDLPGMVVAGEPGGGFGFSVETGNFNGDGFADLVVGSSIKLDEVVSAGALQVIYGANAGLTIDGNQMWFQGRYGIEETPESNDEFARDENALVAGDFNGDGGDDLVVGVPKEDLPGFDNAGVVHVIYSAPQIFADGFEFGDVRAWSSQSP